MKHVCRAAKLLFPSQNRAMAEEALGSSNHRNRPLGHHVSALSGSVRLYNTNTDFSVDVHEMNVTPHPFSYGKSENEQETGPPFKETALTCCGSTSSSAAPAQEAQRRNSPRSQHVPRLSSRSMTCRSAKAIRARRRTSTDNRPHMSYSCHAVSSGASSGASWISQDGKSPERELSRARSQDLRGDGIGGVHAPCMCR